eukprot:COSAG01_NODE_10588_length_2127_cov_2.525148_2_plen_133_part_01
MMLFAQAMEDKPYAIIVDGQSGAVSERQLATHMGAAASPAGSLLAPSVKLLSSHSVDGQRTLVLTRPSLGVSANFTLQDVEIPFISALGGEPHFSTNTFHRNKTAASISLWPAGGQPVCLCEQPAAPYGAAKG